MSRSLLGAAILGAVVAVLAARTPLLLREAILLGPFAAAALIDVRTRRIPNPLALFIAEYALAAAIAGGRGAEAIGASAIVLCVGTAFALGARGAFGMGDVKLLAAAAAVVGLSRLPALIFLVALAGGVAALAMVAVHRRRATTMPYAPAIAVGVAWIMLASPGPFP